MRIRTPATGADRGSSECLQSLPLGMLILGVLLMTGTAVHPALAAPQNDRSARPEQYILVNFTPGRTFNASRPDTFQPAAFDEVRTALPTPPGARIRSGIGFIFSYFDVADQSALEESLRRFLDLAAKTDTPVLVQLDGENWWGARPDLWNWWDPSRPGYNPANRENVEWSGWGPDHAVKIAWRNWGRQIRVLPPPNLMSPRYRQACHQEMRTLIPIIVSWWKALPPDKKDLFVGVKLGWESSIGVNAWYYPNGNDLLDRPEAEDPTTGLKADQPPARGVQEIGYAAVWTAGIRRSGAITEADLAEVARRHLEDLCREAHRLGLPRDHLFTHTAGWKEGELLYQAAVNRYSCPGWSFYRHAGDPRQDVGVQEALRHSSAPFWAASEWLFLGPDTRDGWHSALANTLADPRCRFLTIFNWEGIRGNQPALDAICQVLDESQR